MIVLEKVSPPSGAGSMTPTSDAVAVRQSFMFFSRLTAIFLRDFNA